MSPGTHRARRRPAPLRALVPVPVLAALVAALACSGTPPTAPVATPEEQFDALWSDFDATYPYFGIKGVDWAAARETFRPRAAATHSGDALASVLLELLAPLHDLHVALIDPRGRWIPTWTRSFQPNYDATVWSAYAARWAVEPHGNWGHGWIGAVPYVWVDRWSQPLEGLEQEMESFRDAPGLVIDVRMNPGGNSAYALPLLARIFDQKRIAGLIRYRNGPGHDDFTPFDPWTLSPGGAWQFTKPVLILVGPASASSTEDFTSAARELPHVTIAGATTAGATANPAERALAEGWRYRISQWFFTTPDGIVVEGNGIPPHVAIPTSAADLAAGVDPVLDYAEAWAAAPAVARAP